GCQPSLEIRNHPVFGNKSTGSVLICNGTQFVPYYRFVERIFSLMNAKWSDVRNKCSTALIKAELIVSLNYDMPCSEFYSAALKNKRLLLLQEAKRNTNGSNE
ncbi:Uncharacterized protein FKW44_013438, partial [Caligus rogercresseyi]